MSYFGNVLLRLASWIDNSKNYHKLKEFTRKILEYPHSKWKFAFDIFMVFLVIISVLLLLYEVKNPQRYPYMDTFIQGSLIIFIIEYLARFWIYSDSHTIILEFYQECLDNHIPFSLSKALRKVIVKKIEYIISPLGIIDLLAILPSYRPLRFLRIFVLFRIFKLFRYAKSMKTFASIITEKKFELLTLAIFASFVTFVGSSAIYIFETNENPKIDTLYDAVYWAVVTMGTVGYGDIVPITPEGKAVSMVLVVLGVSILAFLTSIIVSSFQSKIAELKEDRLFADIDKSEDYILICGYGRVGEVIAKMLHDDGYSIVIIDTDPQKIALALSRKHKAILGDATKDKLLEKLKINSQVSKVICVTNSDEMNVSITLSARSFNPNVEIIARVVKKNNKKKYYLAGANFAFNVDETIGLMGREYIDQPISYAALDEMLTENIGVLCETVTLREYSPYVGQALSSLALHEKHLLLFGIARVGVESLKDITSYPIENKTFYFNPPTNFEIHAEDSLIVMGRKHHISHLRKLIDKRPLP